MADITDEVEKALSETYQLDPPINRFTKAEVRRTIRLDELKSPGYDLITVKLRKSYQKKR